MRQAIARLAGMRVVLGAVLAAVAASAPVPAAFAQDGLGKRPPRRDPQRAPSFEGATAWFNTAAPLTWDDLRGKVVLVDFWTFG